MRAIHYGVSMMFALKRVALAFLAGPPLLLSAYAVDASAIYGVNHTHWAINRFSVDGRSAVDIIGPYQGGGGGCCYGAPERWYPGLTVRVDWETGAGSSIDFPGTEDWSKVLAWREKSWRRSAGKAKSSPSRTTPARTSAASPCISCPAMRFRSPPPVTRTAAPSTRSKSRLSCQNLSHARQNLPTRRRRSDGRVCMRG